VFKIEQTRSGSHEQNAQFLIRGQAEIYTDSSFPGPQANRAVTLSSGNWSLASKGLTYVDLTTISILVGIVLGLRFKVFILVPTIGLALALVAVTSMAHGDDVWSLVATMVVVTSFLQLGYIGGSVLAPAIVHGRASAGRSDPPNEQPRPIRQSDLRCNFPVTTDKSVGS